MDILSHGVSGYFVLLLLLLFAPSQIELTTTIIVLTFFFSMLPDLEGLWSKNLTGHHKGFFHTPIFWILISIIVYFLVDKQYAILLGALTLFHLTCDVVTGRTTGVPLLYPFSSKEFSLVKTHPRWGKMDPKKIFSREFHLYVKHYFENTPLIIFEAVMWVLGIASFVYIYLPL